jgi:phage shock protein C
MSLADELEKLSSLHARGVITAEEFQQLKTRMLNSELGTSGATADGPLRRSRTDRWIGGVCGGLARMLGLEPWIVRLAFTLLILFWGTGLVLYILLWIFVPNE